MRERERKKWNKLTKGCVWIECRDKKSETSSQGGDRKFART